MKVKDLKAGYVVFGTYNDNDIVCSVTYNANDNLAISGPDFWCPIDFLKDGLQSDGGSVVINEVYGRTYNSEAWRIDSVGRSLIWKREEAVEMTIEEIQMALGKKIKIVE